MNNLISYLFIAVIRQFRVLSLTTAASNDLKARTHSILFIEAFIISLFFLYNVIMLMNSFNELLTT